MKKRYGVASVGLALSLLLSGCANASNGTYTAADVAKFESDITVNDDSGITMSNSNIKGSQEELKRIVYDTITGNTRINLETDLSRDLGDAEMQMIRDHMMKIIDALKGQYNSSISDDVLNYMLWELAKTQYSWTVPSNGITFFGKTTDQKRYYVDLTFVTTDNVKQQLPNSEIITGHPLEETYLEQRYEDYIAYITAKINYNQKVAEASGATSGSVGTGSIFAYSGGTDAVEGAKIKYEDAERKFINVWGEIDEVLEEQTMRTPIERVREKIKANDGTVSLTFDTKLLDRYAISASDAAAGNTGNTKFKDDDLPYISTTDVGVYTYTGVAGQTSFRDGAKMRFRFVLDVKQHLGSASTFETVGCYLMDYELNNFDEGLKTLKIDEGTQLDETMLKPEIDRMINRYQKCVEENNYAGLYKLFGVKNTVNDYSLRITDSTSRFKDWYKFYTDMGTYCYMKYNSDYNFEIVGWSNSTIKVLVTRRMKIRGKGTNMTMPTYEQVALLTLISDSDNLYIDNEEILKMTLTGEPVSMLKDIQGMAEKLAFSAQAFTDESKAEVLGAIQTYSKAQLNFANAGNSEADFGVPQTTSGCLYKGLSDAKKAEIKNVWVKVGSSVPTEKITHVVTWATVSNSFCKLKIAELFIFGESTQASNTEAYISLTKIGGVWCVTDFERISGNIYNTAGNAALDKQCLCHDYIGRESTSDYVDADGNAAIKPKPTSVSGEEAQGKTLTLEERANYVSSTVQGMQTTAVADVVVPEELPGGIIDNTDPTVTQPVATDTPVEGDPTLLPGGSEGQQGGAETTQTPTETPAVTEEINPFDFG